MSKHIKKRIKNKHQHHEDMLRQQITEELFAEASEQMTKYVKRIDYLVGANNELMEELRALEKRQLVDETSTNEGFENF
jgi:two-component sensor histidine kinase